MTNQGSTPLVPQAVQITSGSNRDEVKKRSFKNEKIIENFLENFCIVHLSATFT